MITKKKKEIKTRQKTEKRFTVGIILQLDDVIRRAYFPISPTTSLPMQTTKNKRN